MTRLNVLVVDDDKNILRTLSVGLEGLGCAVTKCESAEDGLKVLTSGSTPDLILTDVRLGGMTGIDLIKQAKAAAPQALSIAMTAYASFENAVSAIKAGAFDYLAKPFTMAQLEHLLAKVSTVVDLQRENLALKHASSHPEYFAGFTSPAMRRLEEVIRKVAPTDATILIVGESGTGKSEFARLVHARSARREAPFIEVNCAALAETLLESELFGHAKGAFTGAAHDKVGKLEAAHGGTIFLDEVAELSVSGQGKLLRFLQERTVEPVGSSKSITINARVIAATNKKLDECVQRGEFREDLYYRLNVIECAMVPLRYRREDIPVLIPKTMENLAARNLCSVPEIPRDVLNKLLVYDWPGNIRELRNVLERLVIMSEGRTIALDDLPETIKSSNPIEFPETELQSLRDVEREHIKKVIARERNQERAAKVLGINTVTLWRKRKEYGLE